jgi:hypothetical protein
MTTVTFAITYCCQELQIAMIKREYWFEFDTNASNCVLIDENNDIVIGDKCPFCHRSMEDVVDLIIEKKDG